MTIDRDPTKWRLLVDDRYETGPFPFNPQALNTNHVYRIGGIYCNAFVLGEPGAEDDFFLMGTEPLEDSNYPLLTGNIFNSEGAVLFRLVKNSLTFNPGHCSKVLGDRIGYELHDGLDHPIFKVQTRLQRLDGMNEDCWLTTIDANFFNKDQRLVVQASTEVGNEKIDSTAKSAFKIGETFYPRNGMSDRNLMSAIFMLNAEGKIHKIITGNHTDEDIYFDGAALIDSHLFKCRIHINSGEFIYYGSGSIMECVLLLSGPAWAMKELIEAMKTGEMSRPDTRSA